MLCCKSFIFSEPKKRRGTCFEQGPISALFIFIHFDFRFSISILFGHALNTFKFYRSVPGMLFPLYSSRKQRVGYDERIGRRGTGLFPCQGEEVSYKYLRLCASISFEFHHDDVRLENAASQCFLSFLSKGGHSLTHHATLYYVLLYPSASMKDAHKARCLGEQQGEVSLFTLISSSQVRESDVACSFIIYLK